MAYHNSGNLQLDRLYDYAFSLFREKEYEASFDLTLQVLERSPNYLPALILQRDLYFTLKNFDAFEKICHLILSLDKEDLFASRLLLSHYKGEKVSLSSHYVANLYNDFAHGFEDKLVNQLHYSLPRVIFDTLHSFVRPFQFKKVIDCGCGTGLVGKTLSTHAKQIIGNDLSKEMLKLAASKNCYSCLWQGDLHDHLDQFSNEVDLIIAADVLIYLGSLDRFFDKSYHALEVGGYLAFSVEAKDGEGFALHDHLRYHHAKNYLNTLLAAFHVKRFLEITLRLENEKPVNGFLIIVQKPF